RRHGVIPHPAYRLGWGRVSCMSCIFGLADQWASVRKIAPAIFDQIACLECEFGKSIDRRYTVNHLAHLGTPYPQCDNEEIVSLALSREYPCNRVLTANWELPAGAFKHCGGPT